MNTKTSGRLTTKWTKTLEEAFGESGRKGRLGEQMLLKYLASTGHEIIDHEQDYNMQLSGIDVSFKKPSWNRFYTGDCKSNLRDDNSFYIEFSKQSGGKKKKGWLFTCKADRIFHVNTKTKRICYYDLSQLRQRLADYNISTPSGGLLLINSMDARFKDLIRSVKYYGDL